MKAVHDSSQSGSASTRRLTVPPLFCILAGLQLLTGCVNDLSQLNGQATLNYDIDSAAHPEASLDLDTGSLLDNAEADIALLIQGGTDLYSVLIPVNGAKKVNLANEKDISLDDCRQNLDSLSATNIPDFQPGKRICILTNQGQLALVTIADVTGLGPGASSVQVSFVVEPAQ